MALPPGTLEVSIGPTMQRCSLEIRFPWAHLPLKIVNILKTHKDGVSSSGETGRTYSIGIWFGLYYIVHFLKRKGKYKSLNGIFCKLIELWLICYNNVYKSTMVLI